MKRTVIFLFICITFFSCTKKKTEIPDGIISPDTMIHILSEMHLAQASIAVNSIADSNKYTMADYQQYILDQYKIPKPDFVRSIRFYTSSPELMKIVYDSIIIDLTRLQAETKQ